MGSGEHEPIAGDLGPGQRIRGKAKIPISFFRFWTFSESAPFDKNYLYKTITVSPKKSCFVLSALNTTLVSARNSLVRDSGTLVSSFAEPRS